MFLNHNDEANKKQNSVGFYAALVHCTNGTMRCLCRFLHASHMSLMSLVNDIKVLSHMVFLGNETILANLQEPDHLENV